MTVLATLSSTPKQLNRREKILLSISWVVLVILGMAAFYLRTAYFDRVAFNLALQVYCTDASWLIHAWLLPFVFSGIAIFILGTFVFVHVIPYLPTGKVKFLLVGLIGVAVYMLPSGLFGVGFQGYLRAFLTLRCTT